MYPAPIAAANMTEQIMQKKLDVYIFFRIKEIPHCGTYEPL
jgi:hypothetical protein